MTDKHNKGFEFRSYTRMMNWYRRTSIHLPLFNQFARSAMALKFAADKWRVDRYCRGKEREIEAWFGSIKLFFGYSSIRGGTVFLNNLLKIEVPNSQIEHEANLDDYWNLPRVMQDEREGLKYVRDFRKNEIFFRSPHDIGIYGEINPMIRLHCKALVQVFPRAKHFHMVRDPRDVVRSIMGKENLGPKDPLKDLIKPPPSDPYHDRWPEMDRFERVCWEWQYDNRFMRENVPHFSRFEGMMSDYAYFKEMLLDYLELDVSAATWERYVNEPQNASPQYHMRHWTKWDKSQIATLEDICGEEMAMYGYQI